MKSAGKFTKKTFALLLSVLLVLTSVSTVAAALADELQSAGNAPLQAGVISDVHYYPDSLTGGRCEAYLNSISGSSKEYDESQELLDAALYALQKHSVENGMKYVLIPGDLTRDGELKGHQALAQRLLRFEQETGLQVIVTNGNHDINNDSAISFEGGKKHRAEMTSPEQFREIYKDLGWDLACATYTPPAGEKAGMLSYAVELEGNYRLIVMDVCEYSKDVNGLDVDGNITAGVITDSLMTWVLGQIAEAKAKGETVIGMEHHSPVPQFNMHDSIFSGFVIQDWEKRAETLADAGMHFIFTGHTHVHKTTSHVSDNGSVLYDITTASLIGYPNYFREVLFDNTGDVPTASTKTFDVDCEQQITVNGVTYDKPFRSTFSYHRTFGSTLDSFVLDAVDNYIDDFCASVQSNGGVVGALKASFGLDLEAILDDLINGGVSVGSIDIFTTKNLMSLVNNICGQLENKFLQDPQVLKDLVVDIVNQVLDIPVSDKPCTKFIDTYGFGDPSKPGTLGDAAYSALIYFYDSSQDVSDDAFMLDFINYFKNGSGTNALFDKLYDLILNQLVQDTLLSNISLNISALFPSGTLGHLPASFLDMILGLLLNGDKSLENIINSFLSLGFIKDFDSINGIADHYIEEYLTQSQLDSIGFTLSEFIEALTIQTDVDDTEAVLYGYDNLDVEATSENYRLPSMVAVTLGNDASTSRNISWYTKYNVTGTDIELIPYSSNPHFSGTPTTGSGITGTAENVTMQYPGVDLGVIGLLPFNQKLVRHTLTLTSLEPGKKYSYRVGDAEKGWWSETGVIETADGSDDVSFVYVTDLQSQNARQYERFHNVISTAFNLYPDADFVVSAGDQVDSGTNVKQWKWLLDGSSDVLLKTSFMPTTGNHEDDGAALDKIFKLPNVPEQDTDSGVYYSYDYNNVHFMVLNTNDLNSSDALSDTQINWLKKSAGDSDADWKIVVLHKAVYSNGSHYDDDDVVAIRKQLQRLMPELGIDVVLQGHDHVYLRTGPMYNNRVVKGCLSGNETETIERNGLTYNAYVDPYGTFYAISGCGGVKNYIAKSASDTDKLFPRAEAIYTAELSMFSGIRISGDTLLFDAYTVDNSTATRVDSFAIEKSGSANQAASVSPSGVPQTDIQQLSAEASDKADEIAAAADLIDALDEGVDPVTTTTSAASGGTNETTSSSGSGDSGTATTATASGSSASPDSGVTSSSGASGNGSVVTAWDQNDVTDSAGGSGASSSSGDSQEGVTDEDGSYYAYENSLDDSIKTFFATAGSPIPQLGGTAGKVAATVVLFGISAAFALASQVKKKKDD